MNDNEIEKKENVASENDISDIAESKSNIIIKYAATIVALLFFSLMIALSDDLFSKTDARTIIRILCDAFSVPGIIAVGVGLLITIAGTGFFSSIKYLGRSFLGVFIPGIRLKQESYKKYKEKDDKKRKIVKSGFLLFCGAAFLLVGIVFLIVYNTCF